MQQLIKRMKHLHAFGDVLEAVAGKTTDAERARVEDLIASELGLLVADRIDIGRALDKRAGDSDFATLETKLGQLRIVFGETQDAMAFFPLSRSRVDKLMGAVEGLLDHEQ